MWNASRNVGLKTQSRSEIDVPSRAVDHRTIDVYETASGCTGDLKYFRPVGIRPRPIVEQNVVFVEQVGDIEIDIEAHTSGKIELLL